MISVGNNKAFICKGDFHPAALYKGDKKIAGYTVENFEGTGGVTLENCYNDKVYDAVVHGKNLLDVNKIYPAYVNGEGGITYTNKEFTKIYSVNILKGGFKEKTRYTLSFGCEITNADNNGITVSMYDASGNRLCAYYNFGSVSGNKSGSVVLTNNTNATVSYIKIAYTTAGKTCNVKLTNMQLEEGTIATEYEPPCGEANIMVKLMENSEKKRAVLFKNGVLTEDIPTFKGTTVIEIESDIAATISGKYKRME